jgi:hypothetical protein
MEDLPTMIPSTLMLPDRGMLQKFRRYDKKLDAFFNVVNERWTIVRYIKMYRYEGSYNGTEWFQQLEVPWPVLCVQDWDGGYLPLDERAFYLLISGDLQRVDDLDKWCNSRAQQAMDHRAREEHNLRDDIKHLTLESKRQLTKALEPFDRNTWGENAPPPVPMSHAPVEVDLDELTF